MAINWTEDDACTKEHIEEYARLRAALVDADKYMREVIITIANQVARIRQVDFEHDHRFDYEIVSPAGPVQCTGVEYVGMGDYDEYTLDFPLSYLYDWAGGKAAEEARHQETVAAEILRMEEARIKREGEFKAHRRKIYEELKREFEK